MLVVGNSSIVFLEIDTLIVYTGCGKKK